MPTFMQSLNNNPSGGGSSIYGMPASTQPDILGIVNELKDREMNDFKNKATFMSQLSLQQDRQRRIYGLDGSPDNQGPSGQPKNTVMSQDPNQMTGYEKGELGLKQQQLGLDTQKQAQSAKTGQEALDIKSNQEKLNQQKSDQINENKQNDMQRKIDEANQKIILAQQALTDKTANQEAQLKANQDYRAAVEERHKLEMAQKDTAFQDAQRQHDAQIANLQDQIKKRGQPTTQSTEMNADGTKKTVTTTHGSTGTITGTGKDGKQYQVPIDQINDWNQNHAQPGTELSAPQD